MFSRRTGWDLAANGSRCGARRCAGPWRRSSSPRPTLRASASPGPARREPGAPVAAARRPWDLLASAGGWTAVLRLGERTDEEALALALLEDGVAAWPGLLFDFPRPGHLVVSLLPAEDAVAEGARRVAARLGRGTSDRR